MMTDLPSSEDPEWDSLTPEQQDTYNEKIDAENEKIDADNEYDEAKKLYNESMSLKGPVVLGIIGILFGGIFLPALLIIVLAIVWAIIRVAGRSQAYQRYKDADAALKKIEDFIQ